MKLRIRIVDPPLAPAIPFFRFATAVPGVDAHPGGDDVNLCKSGNSGPFPLDTRKPGPKGQAYEKKQRKLVPPERLELPTL
jgi:hypothetical protein